LHYYTSLVIEAIKQNGSALEFVPRCIQSVYDLVVVAVVNNGDDIRFATPSPRDSRPRTLIAGVQQQLA